VAAEYSPTKTELFRDFFISHSRKDDPAVCDLEKSLEEWHFTYYVDHEDTVLQSYIDRALAERLRGIISYCRIFLFAVSDNSITSRWMPWELGLAHGIIGRVLLYPLSKEAERKARQEYLGLYEVVDLDDPRTHLTHVVSEARNAAVDPAALAAMQREGAITGKDLDQVTIDPAVRNEYVFKGPMQLYSAWLQGVTQASFQQFQAFARIWGMDRKR